LAQAMEPLDNAAYAAAATAYAELRDQLHVESLAALALLMDVGAAEAVILLDRLGGRAAVDAVIGAAGRQARVTDDDDAGGSLRTGIAPLLKAAIADPASLPDDAGRKLLLEALAARRKVSRAGFRREDSTDPEMIAALRSGAAAVFDTIRELDR